MNTLFDTAEFSVKPRLKDGSFCSKRTQRVLNELRWCLVGELRRQKCVSKLIREQAEEIIRLKAALNAKFATFEEYDRLAKLF
jgi:hypothetical protein